MLPVCGLALGSFRGWLSGAGPTRAPPMAASAVLLWWLSVVLQLCYAPTVSGSLPVAPSL